MSRGTGPATEDKRERTLETARRYFHAYGYRKASLAGLIAESGISKPTFYNYFRNKEELFLSVMEGTYGEFVYQFGLRRRTAVGAREKLGLFVTTYSWFLDAYPIFRDLAIPGNDLLPRWSGSKTARNLCAEGIDAVEAIIEEGIGEGVFDASLDRGKASVLVYHLIVDVLSRDPLACGRRNGPDNALNAAFLVNFVVRALASPCGKERPSTD
jgi:AcrR family transcriptional regulator